MKKTTKELNDEITNLRASLDATNATASEARAHYRDSVEAMSKGSVALAERVLAAEARAAHAERTVEILKTDVDNLLGTIRVMADSSREVRIRLSSVKPSDIGTALPQRNTERLP